MSEGTRKIDRWVWRPAMAVLDHACENPAADGPDPSSGPELTTTPHTPEDC